MLAKSPTYKILLPVRLFTKERLADKDYVTGLAFALMVKETFKNSRIENATSRRMEDLFGIGAERLIHALHCAESHGFIVYDKVNKVVIAHRLRGKERACYAYTFKRLSNEGKSAIHSAHTLSYYIDAIYKIAIYNKVGQGNFVSDTILTANAQTKVSDYGEIKKAHKLCKRKCWTESFCYLSYAKLADFLSLSRNKVVRLVKELHLQGLISKARHDMVTCLTIDDINHHSFQELKETYGINGYIYFCRKTDEILSRTGNRYKALGGMIEMIKRSRRELRYATSI